MFTPIVISTLCIPIVDYLFGNILFLIPTL